MPEVLSIALVSPHAWPAYDDLTWRIAAEAAALARRGHRVTILAPGSGRELLAESRRVLAALRDGDGAAALAEPGSVRVVPIGRALATGRRKFGGPLDLSAALQDVLSRVAFDVVHVHEPLAPTPALAALRYARGVTAATFHRPEQVSGVAFVRPLLERAIGRLDILTAASETVRRTVNEMFARDAAVIPDAADPRQFALTAPHDGPADVVIVGRGADRAGVRFGVGVVRAVGLDRVGRVTVLGPADAHWRTVAAIPKAMRANVGCVADTDVAARAALFHTGAIAFMTTPEDLTGAVAAEAMAAGMVVVAPRSAEADALLTHGRDGMLLPAFSREAWSLALAELAGDALRRTRIGTTAHEHAAERSIDTVAQRLEALYLQARDREQGGGAGGHDRLVADLRVRSSASLAPREIVDACVARGVDVVAVIGDRSIDDAQTTAQAAGTTVRVIVGQQIHTADGELVGLFLTEQVADDQSATATADAIRAQGGLVMVPHPVWGEPPPADTLAAMRGLVDCFEAVVGPASAIRGSITIENARLMQRFGSPITAGSGAAGPDDLGCAYLRMRSFTTAAEFLAALDDADPVQRRRGLRPRQTRERRRSGTPAT